MRAPAFWSKDGVAGKALNPAGVLFAAICRLRWCWTSPVSLSVPVICVGNLVVGGAGKTPVALSLGERLRRNGQTIHFLSRGYGGTERGPYRVDTRFDIAANVGDEALLLAATSPTWVSHDRAAGAKAAVAAGAEVVIMDDGYQNPSLRKDLSLLVVDGAYGFGNQRLIPAGPLRELMKDGFARADAVVILGADKVGVRASLPNHLPVLTARIVAEPGNPRLAGKRVVAFAGIGRPGKFFDLLQELGCELVESQSYPDHYMYRENEVFVLAEKAAKLNALLVTTSKDAVRISEPMRSMCDVLTVTVSWDDERALDRLLGLLGS